MQSYKTLHRLQLDLITFPTQSATCASYSSSSFQAPREVSKTFKWAKKEKKDMICFAVDWALILALATTAALSSVAAPSTVMATSSPPATANSSAPTADVRPDLAAYAKYVALQQQQLLHRYHQSNDYSEGGDLLAPSDRRSFAVSSNAAGAFNALTDSTGWQHFNSGYSAADGAATTTTKAYQKQQIPIYEEQQENDYETSAGEAAAGEGVPSSGSYADFASYPPKSHDSISRAIYNLRTAGAHNNYDGNNGKFTPALTTYPSHTIASAAVTAPASSSPHAIGKSSDGNFLHHYESNAAYGDLSAADSHSSDEQQLQSFAPHADPSSYSSSSSSSSYPADVASAGSFEHSPPSSSYYDDVNLHYPPSGSGHASSFDIPTQKQPDVVNYIPYPVVKKLHVPVHEPVQIPFSHAVIVPIRKPVPIHIPVAQQVHVPVEQQLKIPVERVVPYPVEKQVPVPVEKRVPYPVVKYVPVKVPQPFPVKVPVFKTVLHKVKGWW